MHRIVILLLIFVFCQPGSVRAATSVERLDERLRSGEITEIAAMTGEVKTIRVRREKSASSEVVAEIGGQETMVLLEKDGDWVRVAVEAGIGYVSVEDFVLYLEGRARDDLVTDPPTRIDPLPPPGTTEVTTTPPPSTPPPGPDTGTTTPPLTPPTPPPTDTTGATTPPTPQGLPLALTHHEPVHLRAEKSLASECLIVIPVGATVRVLEMQGAWCKVEYEGNTGYVRARYLGFREGGSSAGAPGLQAGPTATENGGELHISHQTEVHMRSAKSLASDCPVIIPVGGGLKLLADEGDWVKVEYDGKTGYVRKKYVSPGSGKIPRRIRDEASTPVPGTTPPAVPTTPAVPTPPPPVSTPGTSAPTPPSPPPPSTVDPSSPAYQVFELTNKERQGQGGTAFVLDEKLSAVAQAHAEDMARRNYFNHTNPDGKSPFQRMSAAGISYSTAGENIAINSSPAGAVTAWMNSPGHRRNILNASFRKIGVGVHRGRYVQVFTN